MSCKSNEAAICRKLVAASADSDASWQFVKRLASLSQQMSKAGPAECDMRGPPGSVRESLHYSPPPHPNQISCTAIAYICPCMDILQSQAASTQAINSVPPPHALTVVIDFDLGSLTPVSIKHLIFRDYVCASICTISAC